MVKFRLSYLVKENPDVFKIYAAPCHWDVISEPKRPFHVEIHVIGSPHDQRWCLQRLQTCFNGKRVPIVESREEAPQIAGALFRSDQGTQVGFDAIVTQPLGVFLRRSKGLC